MPELPEVESVCRHLRERVPAGSLIVRAAIVRPGIVRPADPAAVEQELTGQRITRIGRRGKHILLHLSSGRILGVHLRMTGNLYFSPDIRFREASARAWLELPGRTGIVFADPRALGRLELLDQEPASLGPEPLEASFTPAVLAQASRASRAPIKVFLLDQRRVAGVGNIYAAEALFRARINPRKPANRLNSNNIQRLHAAIVGVLEDAVQSAYNAYSSPGRFTEGEEFAVQVYGRKGQPCAACGKPVRRIRQGGRSTYFCGHCQR